MNKKNRKQVETIAHISSSFSVVDIIHDIQDKMKVIHNETKKITFHNILTDIGGSQYVNIRRNRYYVAEMFRCKGLV